MVAKIQDLSVMELSESFFMLFHLIGLEGLAFKIIEMNFYLER